MLAEQRDNNNTFVFTEKDLPKYDKKKSQDATSLAAKQQQQQHSRRGGRFQFNKDRFVPYVKTIPSKFFIFSLVENANHFALERTSLVGKVCHECNVIPSLNDPNYNKVISSRRRLQEEEPRPKVTLLSDSLEVSSGAFSQTLRGQASQFMRAQKKDSKASSEGKATRIPRNELLDLLFKLFESYDYWSLKGLKERTKQPEVYLKEVLDEIAILIKKGPYSMKYSLKPEYKKHGMVGNGVADGSSKSNGEAQVEDGSAGGNPSNEGNEGDEDYDEDDEDDIEMETVV